MQLNSEEVIEANLPKRSYISYCWRGLCISLWTIVILSLLTALLPFVLLNLLIGMVYWINELVFGSLGTVVFRTFVRQVYSSALGKFITVCINYFSSEPHTQCIRTEVTAESGHTVYVYTVPYYSDNYAFVIVDPHTSSADDLASGGRRQPAAREPSDDQNATEPLQGRWDSELTSVCFSHNSNEACGRSSDDRSNRQEASDPPKSPQFEPKKSERKILNAAIVDPGDCHNILRALHKISTTYHGSAQIRVTSILVTHDHWDHTGGISKLLKLRRSGRIHVYAHRETQLETVTHFVSDKSLLRLTPGITFSVVETPGHTKSSVVYCLKCKGKYDECVFTGDTLFLGGCGKNFECPAEDMHHSFWKLAKRCSPRALLFPAHEYTYRLLRDILMNPENELHKPSEFFAYCNALFRAKQLSEVDPPIPTVPYMLHEEMQYNPNFHPIRNLAVVLNCYWVLLKAKVLAGQKSLAQIKPQAASMRQTQKMLSTPRGEIATTVTRLGGPSSQNGASAPQLRVPTLTPPSPVKTSAEHGAASDDSAASPIPGSRSSSLIKTPDRSPPAYVPSEANMNLLYPHTMRMGAHPRSMESLTQSNQFFLKSYDLSSDSYEPSFRVVRCHDCVMLKHSLQQHHISREEIIAHYERMLRPETIDFPSLLPKSRLRLEREFPKQKSILLHHAHTEGTSEAELHSALMLLVPREALIHQRHSQKHRGWKKCSAACCCRSQHPPVPTVAFSDFVILLTKVAPQKLSVEEAELYWSILSESFQKLILDDTSGVLDHLPVDFIATELYGLRCGKPSDNTT